MDRKLNALFICGWYPSRVLPNNGDFIQRHAEAVNMMHKVSVLHIVSDENCTENIEPTSKNINGVDNYISYIKPTKNPFTKSWRFYKAFKKILTHLEDFHVIHLHEIFPFGLFTFFIKKPLIITEHWTEYHYPYIKNIGKLQLLLTKLITKRAQFICPVSLDLKKSMINAGFSGNYKRVPNVVDTRLFTPKPKTENSIFTILHVSNMLDDHKNVSGILNTLALLNFDFKFQLIGNNAKQYKSLATELNLIEKIDFIDHIPHKELVKHMQNADLFVLFSNYENLPCVILESFACGTPVIATNVGGIAEFFPENFGALIPKGDEQQLLEEITKAYEKPMLNSDEMHQYVVNNFSPKVIAKEFSNLYLKSIK